MPVLKNTIMSYHCVFSVPIDVLLVVAAYCQETTEATRTRSQKQQKKKNTRNYGAEKKTQCTKGRIPKPQKHTKATKPDWKTKNKSQKLSRQKTPNKVGEWDMDIRSVEQRDALIILITWTAPSVLNARFWTASHQGEPPWNHSMNLISTKYRQSLNQGHISIHLSANTAFVAAA